MPDVTPRRGGGESAQASPDVEDMEPGAMPEAEDDGESLFTSAVSLDLMVSHAVPLAGGAAGEGVTQPDPSHLPGRTALPAHDGAPDAIISAPIVLDDFDPERPDPAPNPEAPPDLAPQSYDDLAPDPDAEALAFLSQFMASEMPEHEPALPDAYEDAFEADAAPVPAPAPQTLLDPDNRPADEDDEAVPAYVAAAAVPVAAATVARPRPEPSLRVPPSVAAPPPRSRSRQRALLVASAVGGLVAIFWSDHVSLTALFGSNDGDVVVAQNDGVSEQMPRSETQAPAATVAPKVSGAFEQAVLAGGPRPLATIEASPGPDIAELAVSLNEPPDTATAIETGPARLPTPDAGFDGQVGAAALTPVSQPAGAPEAPTSDMRSAQVAPPEEPPRVALVFDPAIGARPMLPPSADPALELTAWAEPERPVAAPAPVGRPGAADAAADLSALEREALTIASIDQSDVDVAPRLQPPEPSTWDERPGAFAATDLADERPLVALPVVIEAEAIDAVAPSSASDRPDLPPSTDLALSQRPKMDDPAAPFAGLSGIVAAQKPYLAPAALPETQFAARVPQANPAQAQSRGQTPVLTQAPVLAEEAPPMQIAMAAPQVEADLLALDPPSRGLSQFAPLTPPGLSENALSVTSPGAAPLAAIVPDIVVLTPSEPGPPAGLREFASNRVLVPMGLPREPGLRLASLTPPGEAPGVKISDTTNIASPGPYEAQWSLSLGASFEADGAGQGLRIVPQGEDAAVPDWARGADARLVSVNGWRLQSAQRVADILAVPDVEAKTGMAIVHLEVLQDGTVQSHALEAEAVRRLATPAGTAFEARMTASGWQTVVTSAGPDSDLKPGDIIVRHFGTREPFRYAAAMEYVLDWSRKNEAQLLEFAILRDGAVDKAAMTPDASALPAQ